MITNMARGIARLKGRELLEKFDKTMYRVAKDGDVSYPTLHRYITSTDNIYNINTEVLFGILIDGLGLSIEEAENLRLGDVFGFSFFEEDSAE